MTSLYLGQHLMYYAGIVSILAVWSLIWKAIALWKAARRKDMSWYIALAIFNTLGILEILYIFVFSKNNPEK